MNSILLSFFIVYICLSGWHSSNSTRNARNQFCSFLFVRVRARIHNTCTDYTELLSHTCLDIYYKIWSFRQCSTTSTTSAATTTYNFSQNRQSRASQTHSMAHTHIHVVWEKHHSVRVRSCKLTNVPMLVSATIAFVRAKRMDVKWKVSAYHRWLFCENISVSVSTYRIKTSVCVFLPKRKFGIIRSLFYFSCD